MEQFFKKTFLYDDLAKIETICHNLFFYKLPEINVKSLFFSPEN